MAEPIGLASGLYVLTIFACQSSITLYKAIDSIQNHPKYVGDLKYELKALIEALGTLVEIVSATPDVDYSNLDLLLLQCGKSCEAFEQEITRYLSQSSSGRMSFQDWANLSDITLRKSTPTAEGLKLYEDLIRTTVDDLEAHLHIIDEKLKTAFKYTTTEPTLDSAKLQVIKEPIPELTSGSSGSINPDDLSKVLVTKCLQEFKDILRFTATKLEGHKEDLIDQSMTKSKTVMTLEEKIAFHVRLREEWEVACQHKDICIKTKAISKTQQTSGRISNASTTQALRDRAYDTGERAVDAMDLILSTQFENDFEARNKLIRQEVEQTETEQRRISNEKGEFSIQEEDSDQDSDDVASTSSTVFSAFSTSSASSYTSRSYTLSAAIDEVVTLLLDDKDIQRFLSNALAKQERYEVSKGITDLLNWLGRRLTNASSSQIEKELAKLFSSLKRNYSISNKILHEIESNNPEGERQNLMETLRNQELSREQLERYLEKQAGSSTLKVPNDEENETSKYDQSGEFDYGDDEDGEEDESNSMSSNIEVARKFLKSNDAFSRFKEELEDFAEPFKSDVIWGKILWDGDERVRFELSNTVSQLTNMDKLKLAAEEAVGMPILWWPLKQPRKYLLPGKARIIWVCSCGQETYVDVLCAEAQKYRRSCTIGPIKARANSSPFLPTANTPSPNSNLPQGWTVFLLALIGKAGNGFIGRFSRTKETHPSGLVCNSNITNAANSTVPLNYIHWCVDTATRRTLLQDICLEKVKGGDFIAKLRSSYRKLRGWRWYLSMTTCADIRLVKLIRVHQDEDVVTCTWKEEVLPKEQTEYKYHLDLPGTEKGTHVLRAEKALIDYYYGHARCPTVDRINALMFGVPHRFTGDKLQMRPGFGIYARQGWTLYRFFVFVFFSQCWALVFMAWWLWHHPGDIQNAFSPAYYSLGLITVLIAIPDTLFP